MLFLQNVLFFRKVEKTVWRSVLRRFYAINVVFIVISSQYYTIFFEKPNFLEEK